eukprot:CAMPEP_0182593100 /NCGR_PEP_ID=MMETSP1324-20130603/77281_1 /TAXON_ID=236786 /ORGANISM="Florenciella sp., Strain RCC1587" /LENGTH=166 /DNA_ID=CAMNT_0024810535 /DNA_START=21 /DNA_END=517 /DNA_ORIENTATION=+
MEMGLNIGAQLDRFKDSFLVAAAKSGSEEEVASLLDMGSDVNYLAPGPDGDTPLLAACRNGHRTVVSMLLDAGADANLNASSTSDSCLHVACSRGDEALATILIEAQANLTRTDRSGNTPIDAAHRSGYESMARRLKQIAARVERRQNESAAREGSRGGSFSGGLP